MKEEGRYEGPPLAGYRQGPPENNGTQVLNRMREKEKRRTAHKQTDETGALFRGVVKWERKRKKIIKALKYGF